MKRRIPALLGALALILGLAGCSFGEQAGETATFFAMDTVMNVTVYGSGAHDAVIDAQREVFRLEALLSRTREDTPVHALNHADGAALEADAELLALLDKARTLSAETGGTFDITVAPLVSAWGFGEAEYRVPAEEEIAALLPLVGSEGILLDEAAGTARLPAGAKVDLGGIAKGYAGDLLLQQLKDRGIEAAALELGGNVSVLGRNPDGELWRVAVKDPLSPDRTLAMCSLTDVHVVSSGAYERYFEENGERYHHIIDPATGRPADSDLLSATVVCADGARADAYSTALYVMGEEGALDFWRSRNDFEAILVTEDQRVLVTEGLAESFLFGGEENGYRWESVRR